MYIYVCVCVCTKMFVIYKRLEISNCINRLLLAAPGLMESSDSQYLAVSALSNRIFIGKSLTAARPDFKVLFGNCKLTHNLYVF